MAGPKITTSKVFLDNGHTFDVRVLSGILVEDLLIQGAKAEGYRVITGIDQFPPIGRALRDYFIKLGVVSE